MSTIRPPKSRTRCIRGDVYLTALIDPFSFLEHLINVEDFFAKEIPESADGEPPDEGRCQ